MQFAGACNSLTEVGLPRADCEHDMGLSSSDMTDLQNTWAQMMNLTQAKVLEKGGFDWRM